VTIRRKIVRGTCSRSRFTTRIERWIKLYCIIFASRIKQSKSADQTLVMLLFKSQPVRLLYRAVTKCFDVNNPFSGARASQRGRERWIKIQRKDCAGTIESFADGEGVTFTSSVELLAKSSRENRAARRTRSRRATCCNVNSAAIVGRSVNKAVYEII